VRTFGQLATADAIYAFWITRRNPTRFDGYLIRQTLSRRAAPRCD
jgi:hypothetical protein